MALLEGEGEAEQASTASRVFGVYAEWCDEEDSFVSPKVYEWETRWY